MRLHLASIVLGCLLIINCGLAAPPRGPQKTLDIPAALVRIVEQLADQVKASLDNLNKQTEKIATNVRNQILEFLEKTADDVQNYFDGVQEEIKNLIGDRILPCLIDRPQEIEGIRNSTNENIQKCLNESQTKFQDLNQVIASFINNTSDRVNDMRASIVACIEEPDWGEKIKCAVDASRVINPAFGQIFDNIRNATVTTSTGLYQIGRDTTSCISNAKEEGRYRTVAVLNEIRDCLAVTTTVGP